MSENYEKQVLAGGIYLITITFVGILFFCKILFRADLFSFKSLISILFLFPTSFIFFSIISKLIALFTGQYEIKE